MPEESAFPVAGQRVLVTGGTRGIGRAISLRFARAGAAVVANYARNEDAAAELQRQADGEGLGLSTLRADITLAKGLDAAAEALAVQDGRVPCLVHCAATGVHGPIETFTRRHWDWTMALNARALFELVVKLEPVLTSGSSILALSSDGAVRAVQDYALVGASKGALESLVRHFARHFAPRGIRANVLAAGSIRTEAWDAFPDRDARLAEATAQTPIGRLVTAEEVASAALFLGSPAASGITGGTVVVDGGRRIVG